MKDIMKLKGRKRIISAILVMVLLINQFFPILSYAVYKDDSDQEKYNLLEISPITKSSSGNYVFYVEFSAIGDGYVGSFYESLSYDTTLFGTARKTTGAANATVANITETNSDFFTFQTKTVKNGEIQMIGTTTDWFCPVDDGDEDDVYGGKLSIFKVYFYLLDPTKWKLDGSNEITEEMISWKPQASLRTGYQQRVAQNVNGKSPTYLDDLSYVELAGFAASASKTVTGIKISKEPTKTTYLDTKNLDFAGGEVEYTYTDGTKEKEDLPTAIANGNVTVSSTIAQSSSKQVKITAGTTNTTWNYYVLDSISVKNNPSKLTYEHGDSISLNGGVIVATYKNSNGASKTEDVNMTNASVNSTKADVNNQTVTLTYGGKTAPLALTVTDPIDLISVTKAPTKVEYDDGQTISFAGGQLTAKTRSGATTVVATDDSRITKSATTASIASVPAANRWTVAGTSLQAGSQAITLTYEGKTTTLDITVNDKISTVTVAQDPTAANKYGTASGSLNLTGLKLAITTVGGGSFTATSGYNVDFAGYNANTLSTQSFNVTYGGIQASNKVNIKLTNYITGITANFTKTAVDYNETKANLVSGSTYTIQYADGTSSSAQNITESMVTGYIQKPNKSLFNSSHEYMQNLTITLSSGTNSFDKVPATAATTVKMKDVLSGITISTNPTLIFDYGTAFSAQGGYIQEQYSSGATGANVSMTNAAVKVTENDGSDVNTKPALSTFTKGESSKTLLVTYTKDGKTFTQNYNIKIKDTVKSIAITTNPSKDFNHGNAFSVGSGKLTVTYKSGATSVIPMTDGNITITQADGVSPVNMYPTNYSADHKTVENLMVEYMGATTTYEITITNDVKAISVHTPLKSPYNVKDTFDNTVGEIAVVRANSLVPEIVAISDSKVTVEGFNSNTENANLPLKIKYTENGITKETSTTVAIQDNVKSITLSGTPIKAQYGKDLDLSKAKLAVEKGSGTSNVNVTKAMLSGYDPNTLGTQRVTVTYGGLTQEFDVEVQDYITGINLIPGSATGKYGDELSTVLAANNVKYEVVYAQKGAQTPNALTDGMIDTAAYNKNSLSAQNLKITYTDTDTGSFTKGETFTKTLSITLANEVVDIEMSVPTKNTYNYGDGLDLTGGKIKLVYADGTKSSDIDMKTATTVITESDGAILNMSPNTNVFSAEHKLIKTLKIKYTDVTSNKSKELDYPITLIDDVKSITIHTPLKTPYNVNDAFDNSVGEIAVVRASTVVPEIIAISDSKVSVEGFSSTTENTALPLTVKYTENGKTVQVGTTVEVKDSVISITLKGEPSNAQYGKELDLSKAKLDIVKGSGSSTIDVAKTMLSGYDPNTLGTQKITLTYGGKTAEFNVVVKDYVKTLKLNPASVIGKVGDSLSTLISANNIEYIVEYASAGDKPGVALTDSMISAGYNANSTSQQTLTVSYTDNDTASYTKGTVFTENLSITLTNDIEKVDITVPSKTTYNFGDSIDYAGGTIKFTYTDTTTGNANINLATITEADGSTLNMSPNASEFNSEHKLTKTLKVSYTDAASGKSDTQDYTITIIDNVKSVSVHTTLKNKYNVNDTFDDSVGEVAIVRASTNIPEIIPLNDSRVQVEGFNTTSENPNLPIIIKFTENGISEQTTINVEIKDSVKSIALRGEPTVAQFGKDLDLTNAKLDVEKGSGSSTVDVTKAMLSGYNPNTLGTQKITLTYEGKTAEFDVVVKDYITGISLNKASVTGKYGDSLEDVINNNGITYTVNYASAGAKTPVALTDSMITTVYNNNITTLQNLIATYTDTDATSYTKGQTFTTQLDIMLVNGVDKVKLTLPTKDTYNYGDSLDYSGGTVVLEYTDGTNSQPLDMATVTVSVTEADGTSLNMSPNTSEFDSEHKLTKTLKITYTDTTSGKSETINYPITLVDNVVSVSIQTPLKDKYNVNESFDDSVGEIAVVRASTNTPEIIPVNDSRVQVEGFSSSGENENLQLTVKFTENGITEQATINVEVKDSVKSITLTGTPASSKFGETLDISGITMTVERGSGTNTETLTPDMISGYDPNTLGKQTITVTVGGKTQTFDVEVLDYIVGVTINPANATGKTKETLSEVINNNSIMYTVEYTSKGPQTAVALDESMVSTGFDSNSIAEQTFTITYVDNDSTSATFGQSFTDTLKILLEEEVEKVEVKQAPRAAKYGEALDLSTLIVEITKDGQPQQLTVTEQMIKGFDKNTLGTQSITVEYGGKSDTFNIEVQDYVTGISINPTSITGNVKDTVEALINSNSITYTVTYASAGAQTPVALTDSMVSGYDDMNSTTPQSLTISYTDNNSSSYTKGQSFTTSLGVTLVDNILSISMDNTPKTNYKYGDPLEVLNGTITVMKNSGPQTIDITPSMITGYDPNTVGSQTLTVTYQGFTTTYTVNVADYLAKIELVKPTKTTYIVGDANIDLTNGQVVPVMASGAKGTAISMNDPSVTVTGFNSSVEGANNITVAYEGFTESFGITITDPVKEVVIVDLPSKTDYKYGEAINVAGGTIKVTKESGSFDIIPMTPTMITGYNSKTLGDQTVEVNYNGTKVGEYIVKVIDYISYLKVNAPSKVEYEYGDDLDLTDGTVNVVMASGAIQETTELTASMLKTEYKPKKAGIQIIEVEYKDLISKFNVRVVDKVKGMSIMKVPNKTTYKYGENIDATGGKIQVIRSSGIYTIDITNDMISGYNAKKSGIQKVIITYGELTDSYIVEVSERVIPQRLPIKFPTIAKNSTEKIEKIEEIEEVIQEEIVQKTPENTNKPKPTINKKPTATLGEKDEVENNDYKKTAAIMIAISGLLLLLLLMKARFNVKVYVEENGEFVLGGIDKLNKKKLTINIDQYLDNETINGKVKVVLNKAISRSLENKQIILVYKDAEVKYKVKYNEDEYEIDLEPKNQKK